MQVEIVNREPRVKIYIYEFGLQIPDRVSLL